MIDEPVLDVEDIQGNIIPGFKKDSQHFLFFQIADAESARAWLKSMAMRFSNAREVLDAHKLWKAMRAKFAAEPDNLDFLFINCALSAQGLKRLGVANLDKFSDTAFKLGQEERATSIGDPEKGSGKPGAPDFWKFGAGDAKPDVLLIIAADDLEWAIKAEGKLVEEANLGGLTLIHVDRGRIRPGIFAGHEHFGFKDGVSHPAVRGVRSDNPQEFVEARSWDAEAKFDIYRELYAAPGRPLVWTGHFIFGHPRQKRDEPEKKHTPPPAPDWAKNGSFLVYRRLAQDVPKFHNFLAEAAELLRQEGFDANLTTEKLGALLVGRWASGWCLMRNPGTDHGENQIGENHFTFTDETTVALPGDAHPLNASDPDGVICPFASHIRKVNPRDDATDIGNKERTFQKLMLRRGITFGPEMDEPDAERGLIFVSYQTSITDQFEFLMNDWVNDADKPHAGGGVDAILSSKENSPVRLVNNNKEYKLNISGGWITATGGEYMFAPSIRFFTEVL